jgi:hypothetical protein
VPLVAIAIATAIGELRQGGDGGNEVVVPFDLRANEVVCAFMIAEFRLGEMNVRSCMELQGAAARSLWSRPAVIRRAMQQQQVYSRIASEAGQ